MSKLKTFLRALIMVDSHIRFHIAFSRAIYYNIPFLGKWISYFLDWLILIIYGIDLKSFSVNVRDLNIPHPNGVLLGGNGIVSKGKIVINSGVMFGGVSPLNNHYLERHKTKTVFILGDNVVIGMGTSILGPVTICDNVIIGAMSLVNKDITEPGIYVGIPVKKIKAFDSNKWI